MDGGQGIAEFLVKLAGETVYIAVVPNRHKFVHVVQRFFHPAIAFQGEGEVILILKIVWGNLPGGFERPSCLIVFFCAEVKLTEFVVWLECFGSARQRGAELAFHLLPLGRWFDGRRSG